MSRKSQGPKYPIRTYTCLTAPLLAKIDEAADRLKWSRAQWIRETIIAALAQEATDA